MTNGWEIARLRDVPTRAAIFYWSTLAVAVSAVILATDTISHQDLVRAGLLAVAALTHAELMRNVERARWRRETIHNDLNSTWTVAACLLLPLPLSAILIVVIYGHVWLRIRRTPAYRRSFNIAMFVISAAVTTAVFRLGGEPLAERLASPSGLLLVLAAALCYPATFVIILPVWLVLARLVARPFRTIITSSRRGIGIEAGTICLAVLTAAAMELNPLLVFVGLALVLILHRNELIHQVEEAARTDAKTGLLNATAWSDTTRDELARAQRRGDDAGVLIVDLDLFKKVNDTYGHLAGDDVLRAVATTLRAAVRGSDKVGRFGGEEFVVLLPACPVAQMVGIGERIRRRVEKLTVPSPNGSGSPMIGGLSVSVGAAAFPVHGQDLDQLLAAADQALYEAKHNGRNQLRIAVVDSP